MSPEQLLIQIDLIRSITLKAVETVTDEEADMQPPGFNNTIRWHLGHIYLVQERLAFHFAGFPVYVPPEYIDLFSNGTKPSDWKKEAPSLAELTARLTEQPERIRTLLGDKLKEEPAIPCPLFDGKLTTIGAIINFSLFHEGMHNSALHRLKRALHLLRA
ncbi:DinB family protein [Paenibacillus alkalitolerans]|uniref:DinB family protein n=1 Tax=Paenibacillus alkalitolerans TaxID=2799335 RepID=UPI0018F5EB10|nr:DinB family protein [Paenibacillus alkalitolerans]